MLISIITAALFGFAWQMLLEKWKVDDFFRLNVKRARFWSRETCELCRRFWAAFVAIVVLTYLPQLTPVVCLFATIPIGAILQKLLPKSA